MKVRQRGLDPEMTSFLFKLLHRILPTAARVSRILPNSSSFCATCKDNVLEELDHTLIYCQANGDVGHTLLALVTHFAEANTIFSVTDILTFNFEGSTDDHTFSLIWFRNNLRNRSAAQNKEQTRLYNAKILIRDFLIFFTNV